MAAVLQFDNAPSLGLEEPKRGAPPNEKPAARVRPDFWREFVQRFTGVPARGKRYSTTVVPADRIQDPRQFAHVTFGDLCSRLLMYHLGYHRSHILQLESASNAFRQKQKPLIWRALADNTW